MSDLVARLRAVARRLPHDPYYDDDLVLDEAADAIERLTAERDANFRALMAEHSSLLREGERSSRAEARLAAAERVVEALIQLHGTDCYIENEYGHSCDQFRAIMAAANAADLNSAKPHSVFDCQVPAAGGGFGCENCMEEK